MTCKVKEKGKKVKVTCTVKQSASSSSAGSVHWRLIHGGHMISHGKTNVARLQRVLNDLPGGNEYFKGTIRDVRVYGRALSASEIDLISGINHAPVLPPVANQNISAGQTFLVTNTAR